MPELPFSDHVIVVLLFELLKDIIPDPFLINIVLRFESGEVFVWNKLTGKKHSNEILLRQAEAGVLTGFLNAVIDGVSFLYDCI